MLTKIQHLGGILLLLLISIPSHAQNLRLLTEGQTYTAGKGEHIVILDVLIDVGENANLTAGDGADFCGKIIHAPFMKRVLMVQGMVLAFKHPDEKSEPISGAIAYPMVTLPATFPEGTKICVPKKHNSRGVLIEIIPAGEE
jgi:hypothetical protein